MAEGHSLLSHFCRLTERIAFIHFRHRCFCDRYVICCFGTSMPDMPWIVSQDAFLIIMQQEPFPSLRRITYDECKYRHSLIQDPGDVQWSPATNLWKALSSLKLDLNQSSGITLFGIPLQGLRDLHPRSIKMNNDLLVVCILPVETSRLENLIISDAVNMFGTSTERFSRPLAPRHPAWLKAAPALQTIEISASLHHAETFLTCLPRPGRKILPQCLRHPLRHPAWP